MRDTDYERASRRDSRYDDSRNYDDAPNFGSARSDYGNRAYGGRLDGRGRETNDRGVVARTTDEVKSWFGDDAAERRRRMDARDDARDDSRYDARDNTPTSPGRTVRYDSRYDARDDERSRDFASYRRSQYERHPGRELAADLMTTEVATARDDDPVVRAARVMRDQDVGSLPVVDRVNRPVGVITDRDITCRAVAQGADLRRTRVEDVMTDEVFSCNADASVEECIRVMSRHQVRRLLVVDRDGRLVGIISQADLARRATNERRAVADMVRDVSKPSSQPYR